MRLGRFLISSASLILKVRNLQTRKGKGLFWDNCYSCYSFSSLNFIIWYLKVMYWKHICKFLLQKLTIFFSVTEGNWTFGLGTVLLLTMKHYAGTLMQISNAVLVSQSNFPTSYIFEVSIDCLYSLGKIEWRNIASTLRSRTIGEWVFIELDRDEHACRYLMITEIGGLRSSNVLNYEYLSAFF